MLEYNKDFRYAFDSISNMLDYPNSLLKNSAKTYKEYFQTHYKITDENFTLYSKGENNIDDGGKHDRWDKEKTGVDDELIWPRNIRRKKIDENSSQATASIY